MHGFVCSFCYYYNILFRIYFNRYIVKERFIFSKKGKKSLNLKKKKTTSRKNTDKASLVVS